MRIDPPAGLFAGRSSLNRHINMLNLTIKTDNDDNETKYGQRLSFLTSGRISTTSGRAYTRFVRSMRLLLPLIAIIIVWLVVSWPNMKDNLIPVPGENVLPKNVGQNELLRPRFQSMDSKGQPFNITAYRAMQSSHDPSVIILERPMADMTLDTGSWLAAEAKKGVYRKKADKLLLEGDVKLYRDDGYQLETDKLLINLDKLQAWSDVNVYAQGPAGTLNASGMQAGTGDGKIIFTGPVKLTLNRAIKGL